MSKLSTRINGVLVAFTADQSGFEGGVYSSFDMKRAADTMMYAELDAVADSVNMSRTRFFLFANHLVVGGLRGVKLANLRELNRMLERTK